MQLLTFTSGFVVIDLAQLGRIRYWTRSQWETKLKVNANVATCEPEWKRKLVKKKLTRLLHGYFSKLDVNRDPRTGAGTVRSTRHELTIHKRPTPTTENVADPGHRVGKEWSIGEPCNVFGSEIKSKMRPNEAEV